ncbi:MAG: response regulator [Desulfobacteraceae bacterium]|nr:response regulator [Desulfobacteraceae bacterium]
MTLSFLLVDDSKIVRIAMRCELKAIFQSQKFEISEASNGDEALELIFQQWYDLILLDLTMPGKTGYEVMEILKEKGIHRNIIVLTADIQPKAEKKVLDLGATGYIKKKRPLDRESLVSTLKGMKML